MITGGWVDLKNATPPDLDSGISNISLYKVT